METDDTIVNTGFSIYYDATMSGKVKVILCQGHLISMMSFCSVAFSDGLCFLDQ